ESIDIDLIEPGLAANAERSFPSARSVGCIGDSDRALQVSHPAVVGLPTGDRVCAATIECVSDIGLIPAPQSRGRALGRQLEHAYQRPALRQADARSQAVEPLLRKKIRCITS